MMLLFALAFVAFVIGYACGYLHERLDARGARVDGHAEPVPMGRPTVIGRGVRDAPPKFLSRALRTKDHLRREEQRRRWRIFSDEEPD